MPIVPDDLQSFSKALSADTNHQSEVAERASISRSYYAAFHSALSIGQFLVLPEPPKPSSGGSHQKLFARLLACESHHSREFNAVKSVGSMASRTLNPFRTAADYYLDKPLPTGSLEETIARVDKILEQTNRIIDAGHPPAPASSGKPKIKVIR